MAATPVGALLVELTVGLGTSWHSQLGSRKQASMFGPDTRDRCLEVACRHSVWLCRILLDGWGKRAQSPPGLGHCVSLVSVFSFGVSSGLCPHLVCHVSLRVLHLCLSLL